MSKRRSDAQQTRQQLVAAGRKAFAKKGLRGVVLRDDVLRPAGVSTGSFYHQFENKTDLLLAILKDNAEAYRANVLDAMKPREGDSLEDQIRSSYTHTFDNADNNGDIFMIGRRERSSTDKQVATFLADNHKLWEEELVSSYLQLFPASNRQQCLMVADFVIHQGQGVVEDYLKLPKAKRSAARKELLEGLVKYTVGGITALLGNPVNH
jgi:AcrR family transcriptional regulator